MRAIIFFFVLVSIAIPAYDSGTNSLSRLATMAAMSESNSFRIDSYISEQAIPKRWTNDWAQTPDGAYYSNKAPGPMLLAFPLYKLIDFFVVRSKVDVDSRMQARFEARYLYGIVLSLFFQVIPFAFLVFYFLKFLRQKFLLSERVLFLGASVLCFAHTAALFMTSWFGHGITALTSLAALFFLLKKQWFLCGFMAGLSLLCDYSALFLFPGLLVGIWGFWETLGGAAISLSRLRSYVSWSFGGVIPGLLWIWYHQLSFGSPFYVANKFQNPEHVDMNHLSIHLWGIFAPLPSLGVARELLFGASRGLLYTQPWVLLAACMALMVLLKYRFWTLLIPTKINNPKSNSLKTKSESNTMRLIIHIVSLSYFVFLFWMNSCFGGYHGGSTPGPRYLSAAFPLLAISLIVEWPQFSRSLKFFTNVLVAVSLIFSFAVISTTIMLSNLPLWPQIFSSLVNTGSTPRLRFTLLMVIYSVLLAVFSNHSRKGADLRRR